MNIYLNFWNNVLKFAKTSGWKILLVISILIIAFVLIKFLSFILSRILFASKVDNAAVAFYDALLKLVLWIITAFQVADVLGIATSSLIVALSSCAIAVGLALKDSLANLANGILIIYNRPFKRGDHIKVNGVEGKIQNIKLLTTTIITFDNTKITMPNSSIINNPVVNYTALSTRRADFIFTVSYDSDLAKVESTIKKVLDSDKNIHKIPSYSIYLSNQGDSSLEYTVKCWVNTDIYWDVMHYMIKKMYEAFVKNGIQIPYNQMDIHIDGLIEGGKKND